MSRIQGRHDRRPRAQSEMPWLYLNDSLVATYFLICLFLLEAQSMAEGGGSGYMKSQVISFLLIQAVLYGNALMTCRS